MTLPDTSPEVAEFVSGVVAESGGSAFELSVPEGLEALADSMLGGSGGGSLVGLIQDVLEPQDLLTSSVTVTPGTGETTLVFFKEDPFGTVRLSNPSGLEVAAGDPAALYVEESPTSSRGSSSIPSRGAGSSRSGASEAACRPGTSGPTDISWYWTPPRRCRSTTPAP